MVRWATTTFQDSDPRASLHGTHITRNHFVCVDQLVFRRSAKKKAAERLPLERETSRLREELEEMTGENEVISPLS